MEKIWKVLKSTTFWTTLFTGLLTIFTYKLKEISNTTSEIERSSQRAFVALVGPQMGARIVANVSDPNSQWVGQEIAVLWNNAGNTPARDVVVKTNANAFFPDLPDPFDFPLGPGKTQMVLGPKQQYGTNGQLAKDVIVDAWHRKKRLFIWGSAVYKDVFPNSPDRLTEFCVELTHLTANVPSSNVPTTPTIGRKAPPGTSSQVSQILDMENPAAIWIGFQWQQCKGHNCYDEDCLDYKNRVKDTRR